MQFLIKKKKKIHAALVHYLKRRRHQGKIRQLPKCHLVTRSPSIRKHGLMNVYPDLKIPRDKKSELLDLKLLALTFGLFDTEVVALLHMLLDSVNPQYYSRITGETFDTIHATVDRSLGLIEGRDMYGIAPDVYLNDRCWATVWAAGESTYRHCPEFIQISNSDEAPSTQNDHGILSSRGYEYREKREDFFTRFPERLGFEDSGKDLPSRIMTMIKEYEVDEVMYHALRNRWMTLETILEIYNKERGLSEKFIASEW